MMKWKSNYRNNEIEDDEQPQQFPIYLNLPQKNDEGFTYPPANIRVVDNKVFFYGDISDPAMLELNRVLTELDNKLQHIKISLGDEYTPVCHLHLQTPGGEIWAAFSTIDVIKNMKSDVYTYVDGAVASAGTLISVMGKKRFMSEYGQLLIHQLSGGMYGKFSEMEDDFYNSENLMKLLKTIYKKHTKIPMKKLDELLKRDIWMSAEECKQFGIIDEIR